MKQTTMLLLMVALAAGSTPARAQETVNPHGTLRTRVDCSSCHTATSWKPARKEMKFDHKATGFPLTGRHTVVDCVACHAGLRFAKPRAQANDCAACHTDTHQGRLGKDCASCHTTRSFLSPPGPEAHARTSLPLTGAHAQVPCEGCHRDARAGRFTALDARCISCHQTDYQRAQPDHEAMRFPATCQQCHSNVGWAGARFEHQNVAPNDCISCHRPDYDRAHPTGGYPATCLTCHTGTGTWGGAAFTHLTFPLSGAHAAASCSTCHAPSDNHLIVPRPASPSDCVACHRSDYEAEHAGTGFPETCRSCHQSDVTWSGASFDHGASANGYSLLGAHIRATCGSCHTANGGLKVSPPPANNQDCVACHRPDYDRKHANTGYPVVCMSCHNNERWADATFVHTRFPLVGVHTALPCSACHAQPGNQLIFPVPSGSSDCVACHRSDYDREHAGSGYPTTCTSCHRSNDTWSGATFDHAATANGYVLLGAHIRATCGSCHTANGGLKISPPPASNQDCVACHRPDYDRKHTGSGYPVMCMSCHNNERWADATFVHSRFPLTGAHSPLPCTACHVPGGSELIYPVPAGSSDCVACHRADYDRQHANTGFPLTCASCHTINSWSGATFDHGTVSNGFALLGAHIRATCGSCHTPGGGLLFSPPPSSNQDCVACHRPDYDRRHAGSGYPLTCTTCHQMNDWSATFDHDAQFFPIYSGAHREKWTSCQQCHTSQADFRVFTCLTCHAASDTNDDHREVTGYSYESSRCLACHPRGNN